MFDLNYFKIINAMREREEQLSDYSKFKLILGTKDGYENLYLDLFVKYNIDLELYAKMRKYEMICDAYFKNYDRRYFLKKLNNQFGIFHITE